MYTDFPDPDCKKCMGIGDIYGEPCIYCYSEEDDEYPEPSTEEWAND